MIPESPDGPVPAVFAVHARPGALLLRAALPGFEAKDVALEIDGNALTLSGRWTGDPECAASVARHLERPQGSFRRTLRFAFEIDAERVEARLERGILDVVLPALASPRGRIPR